MVVNGWEGFKMKLRSVYSAKKVSVALAVALIPLIQSAGLAQSLAASANPPSGGAGLNASYLTGSGFPAGAITGATVHFGTSCATPAIASGAVIQVTTQGVLRRFAFLIPASLSPATYQVWVSGTAGGTVFNTLNTPSCSAIKVTANITGTASLGAAISGGAVTLADANGNIATGTTASDGTYILNAGGLTPPYLVRVVTASASGPFPAGTTLYSVSADGNVSTHINVHILSDLILRSFYSAQGIDPDTAFANPAGANAAPTPAAVQSLASLVIPAVQLWLNNAGVNAIPGPPANGAINLISSPFTAYPPGVTPAAGLDAALHLIKSEVIDPGNVTRITIGNATVTETITPIYSGDVVTLNTVTTNTTTGASTSETFTGLVITSANQSVVAGIDATLAAFAAIVNANGSALTGAELLPIYASDYVNDGLNAAEAANAFVAQLAGITANSLQVQSLNSLNTTTNVADVIVAYNITQGGQNQSGTTEWFFQNQGGTWLMYGDQRIASLQLGVGGRHYEGTSNFTGNIAEADVSAPLGTISSASVTSSLSIWPAGKGSTNTIGLAQEPTLVSSPVNLDQFGADSNPILPFPQHVIPAGTPFTFTVTPVSGPAVQYAVNTNADTTETISITSPTTPGLANAHLGSPLLVSWTLPQTFAVTSIDVAGVTFNGPENSPSTLECDIDVSPANNATSASITLPASCGGSPVVNAWVRVSIGGLNVSTGAWFFF